MADNTKQMIALLGAMRKQMNGAVADAMHYYGAKYGLNYGVSLPTVREIARREGTDHALALYLYKQQVRELRLAALHIADPKQVTLSTIDEWVEGVINSEVAEEMAFALLRYVEALPEIFDNWITSQNEMLAYAALMAAAATAVGRKAEVVESVIDAVEHFPHSRIIAQGAVATLAAAAECDVEARRKVEAALIDLNDSVAAQYLREEMEWRLKIYQ